MFCYSYEERCSTFLKIFWRDHYENIRYKGADQSQPLPEMDIRPLLNANGSRLLYRCNPRLQSSLSLNLNSISRNKVIEQNKVEILEYNSLTILNKL